MIMFELYGGFFKMLYIKRLVQNVKRLEDEISRLGTHLLIISSRKDNAVETERMATVSYMKAATELKDDIEKDKWYRTYISKKRIMEYDAAIVGCQNSIDLFSRESIKSAESIKHYENTLSAGGYRDSMIDHALWSISWYAKVIDGANDKIKMLQEKIEEERRNYDH